MIVVSDGRAVGIPHDDIPRVREGRTGGDESAADGTVSAPDSAAATSEETKGRARRGVVDGTRGDVAEEGAGGSAHDRHPQSRRSPGSQMLV